MAFMSSRYNIVFGFPPYFYRLLACGLRILEGSTLVSLKNDNVSIGANKNFLTSCVWFIGLQDLSFASSRCLRSQDQLAVAKIKRE